MSQKTTLVCFRDGSDEIIGLNILYFYLKGNTFLKDIEEQTKTKDFRDIFKIFDICYVNYSTYDKYNVDRYIGSMGLSVQKKYRGIALGTRMLEARWVQSVDDYSLWNVKLNLFICIVQETFGCTFWF